MAQRLRSPLSSLGSQIGLRSEADSNDTYDSPVHSVRGERVGPPRVLRAPRPGRLHDRLAHLGTCSRVVCFNVGDCTVQEAYREFELALPRSTYDRIAKVDRITNLAHPPRIDVWIDAEAAPGFCRYMREMTMQRGPSQKRRKPTAEDLAVWFPAEALSGARRARTMSGWRFAVWKSWSERHAHAIPRPLSKGETDPRSWNRFATLNINGFPSKRGVLEQFLVDERIAVCALQETLVSTAQYPIRVAGYNTYAMDWCEGFRGQAILVRDCFASYRVPHDVKQSKGYQYLIHVKLPSIPDLVTSGPLHFVGVYLPSGGCGRGARTAGFNALLHLMEKIRRREPGAAVVALGDWNSEPIGVERKLDLCGVPLTRLPPVGSARSRFSKRGVGSSLDHMAVSPVGRDACFKPRVNRHWLLSDHRPLISAWRTKMPVLDVSRPGLRDAPKYRYSREALAARGPALVDDNRWSRVRDMDVRMPGDVSALGAAFSETLRNVTKDSGIAVGESPPSVRVYMPRKLKGLLREFRQASRSLELVLGTPLEEGEIRMDYLAAKSRFKHAYKVWQRGDQQKHYARIAEDLVVHDHRNVWRRLLSRTQRADRGCTHPPPVRNRRGDLCTNVETQAAAIREHYNALASDVEGYISDEEYWNRIEISYPASAPVVGLHGRLAWAEVVKAIRGMNRDTAPGSDGMHSNLLKSLLREEYKLQVFGMDRALHPEHMPVTVVERKLPEEPLSNMGQALWKVLTVVWDSEILPDEWNDVMIANLFKKGDPELLVNYRGLSLISVTLKVLSVLMAHRLDKLIHDRSVSLSRSQSGFRPEEEAISQFLVLAETVRRRHLVKSSTFGIFIDLAKAYDRVPRLALKRIMRHRGLEGKFTNVLWRILDGSVLRVRTSGKLSEPFPLLRGLRQGCPLSPLLFVLYIDHLLVDTRPTREGVSVPYGLLGRAAVARRTNPDRSDQVMRLDGGMYADDVVCFEETLEDCQSRCENIVAWGEKWGMAVTLAKCGILLWSDDDALRGSFDGHTFESTLGVFPKVKCYTYLGVEVTEALPYYSNADAGLARAGGCTDAMRHAKTRAAKGLKTLSVLKPLLRDKACPLPLKIDVIKTFVCSVMWYGGEFIGFNQRYAEPIQRVINLALRWAVGVKKTSTRLASLVLSVEFGIPLAYEMLAMLRARLYHKLKFNTASGMQTWLPDLQAAHAFHPSRTWTSENELWIKRYHAPSGTRSANWYYGESGKYKYARPSVEPTPEWLKEEYTSFPIINGERVKVVDMELLSSHREIVRAWFAGGRLGATSLGSEDWIYTHWSLQAPECPFPIRTWYAWARIQEMHRRSNRYRSISLRQYRQLVTGVSPEGWVLPSPLIDGNSALFERGRRHLKVHLGFLEHREQYARFAKDFPAWDRLGLEYDLKMLRGITGGGSKNSDERVPRRTFMTEVKECALERVFSTRGVKLASFANWYDRFQFGATRDWFRTSLTRPDLVQGVRWLVLVRSGGFPRVHDVMVKAGQPERGTTCVLCGGRIPVGWDWIHLSVVCSDLRASLARGQFLGPALDYLLDVEVLQEWFVTYPDRPASLGDLPTGILSTPRAPGPLVFGAAIRLAGGCLVDPRESVFLLSYGQSDIVLTGLVHYGFVYLASFLQVVAPIYLDALGRDTDPRFLEPAAESSLLGTDFDGLSNMDMNSDAPARAVPGGLQPDGPVRPTNVRRGGIDARAEAGPSRVTPRGEEQARRFAALRARRLLADADA